VTSTGERSRWSGSSTCCSRSCISRIESASPSVTSAGPAGTLAPNSRAPASARERVRCRHERPTTPLRLAHRAGRAETQLPTGGTALECGAAFDRSVFRNAASGGSGASVPCARRRPPSAAGTRTRWGGRWLAGQERAATLAAGATQSMFVAEAGAGRLAGAAGAHVGPDAVRLGHGRQIGAAQRVVDRGPAYGNGLSLRIMTFRNCTMLPGR
jgi:hypothetical protein